MNSTQWAAPPEPHIMVYGHGDKSPRGFPTHDDMIRYINDDIANMNQWRYRYTQSKNANIIVLSQDGLAFGHFLILRREKPTEADRADYLPVKCVYIVGESFSYETPVKLLPILERQVNPFGISISVAEFSQIKLHAGHIHKLECEESTNIFRHYENLENHLTNQLLSILNLSCYSIFLTSFLNTLGIDQDQQAHKFRVLRGIDGTADAELSGDDFCILFETKIERGRLDEAQIRRHLERIETRSETHRCLVLLTPDDSSSNYLQQFLNKYHRVWHLEWKGVYELLERSIKSNDLFSELGRQFLDCMEPKVC